ncbi:hypothetical protein CEXT_237601 [Caerostris extrusa]|uniref:Uncharacterized protein n=1 Tax=Caerostris extrusa TaxID=172846 RepID=A0AAV4Y3S6_CAEEX|nr:hypothetical protein CEXT_237601 [Caerostris extrusa]
MIVRVIGTKVFSKQFRSHSTGGVSTQASVSAARSCLRIQMTSQPSECTVCHVSPPPHPSTERENRADIF